MKKIFNHQAYVLLFFSIMLSLTTAISFAQDSAVSSGGSAHTTTSTSTEATNVPTWVWVLGGIIILAIIIGIINRKGGGDAGHTDRVTYTKTTSTD